jgi:hypothetical protein
MDVHGSRAVAELAERVPEAGRVGAAGDEARDLAPRGDQVVPPDVRFDALEDVHLASVPQHNVEGA